MSNETKFIEVARESAERGIEIARSPDGPALLLSSPDTLEREHLRTLRLCDALEASRERERRLRDFIASRIKEEASSHGGLYLTAIARIQAYEDVLDVLNERSYEEDE